VQCGFIANAVNSAASPAMANVRTAIYRSAKKPVRAGLTGCELELTFFQANRSLAPTASWCSRKRLRAPNTCWPSSSLCSHAKRSPLQSCAWVAMGSLTKSRPALQN